jgi:inosine-uridine nucleoside N-ribohydrolase
MPQQRGVVMARFPILTPAFRIERLQPPTGKIRMVLDTDTANEIDDQFAVVYSLLSRDRLAVEAIYAAPFDCDGDPQEGMEKSHEEILRLLDRLSVSPEGLVHRGSTMWLSDPDIPVQSAAAEDLVSRALSGPDPLYVIAIGAPTNVASAVLLQPEIVEHIVVVWLGGQALHWRTAEEFNLGQNLNASQILFDCGVPLIQIPCWPVASHLRTTVPEIERYVEGRGPIGDYPAQIFKQHHSDHFGWSKEIRDISAVGWCPNSEWVLSAATSSPILTDERTWSIDHSRHPIRTAICVHRDPIFRDLFRKLDDARQ